MTGGLSKAYALPGLRMGWVVGPAKTIEQLWGHHDYTSIGPTMLTDRLASIALEPTRRAWILTRTREILRKNYPAVRDWFTQRSDLISHVPPKAGAIAWAGLRDGRNTMQMMEEMKKLGAATLAIANRLDDRARKAADFSVELGLSVPEFARPAAYTIAGQLYGVYNGLKKGLNPDSPKNLSRVVMLE